MNQSNPSPPGRAVNPGDMRMITLDLWRDYIMKSHDDRAVRDLLHPDAVFESPVVHTPQRGRD